MAHGYSETAFKPSSGVAHDAFRHDVIARQNIVEDLEGGPRHLAQFQPQIKILSVRQCGVEAANLNHRVASGKHRRGVDIALAVEGMKRLATFPEPPRPVDQGLSPVLDYPSIVGNQHMATFFHMRDAAFYLFGKPFVVGVEKGYNRVASLLNGPVAGRPGPHVLLANYDKINLAHGLLAVHGRLESPIVRAVIDNHYLSRLDGLRGNAHQCPTDGCGRPIGRDYNADIGEFSRHRPDPANFPKAARNEAVPRHACAPPIPASKGYIP